MHTLDTRTPSGRVSQQYCDMERQGCGTSGGWMRVANFDPKQNCPPGLRLITSPKRVCGRPCRSPWLCVCHLQHTWHSIHQSMWESQDKSPDAFTRYILSRTSDQVYTGGVSLMALQNSISGHLSVPIVNGQQTTIYQCMHVCIFLQPSFRE